MGETHDILLAILAILTAGGFLGASWQLRRQHEHTIRILSDLATMIGDAIDALLEDTHE